MVLILKFFALISLFSLISNCNPPPPTDEPGTGETTSASTTGQTTPDSILQKAQEEHGPSGSCAESEDCQVICNNIYKNSEDKTKCINELPVKQVELLEETYILLEDPYREGLNKINPDNLQVLMGITVEPVVTLFNQMSQVEAREILTWLAESKKFMPVFKSRDRRFKVFKAILGKIHGDPDKALSASIKKGDNFIEIAVEKKNYGVVDWIHEFFEEDCGTVNDHVKCIFKEHYCNLKLNSRTENSYFAYNPFFKLLERTLKEARPASPPDWWNENTGLDDLDSWLSEPHNVCAVAEFE